MKIADIIKQLSEPVNPQLLDRLSDKGNAPYIPWHVAVKVMDERAAIGGWGWEIEVKPPVFSAERIFIVVCVKIHADDGVFCREATGTETLKFTKRNGEVIEQPMGDPSSNAESMAKRRAMAQFGLGLYLYDKEGRSQHTTQSPQQPRTTSRPTNRPQTQPATQGNGQGIQGGISEKQASRLYAIAASNGWKSQQVKALLNQRGYESALHLPWKKYDATIQYFQTHRPK